MSQDTSNSRREFLKSSLIAPALVGAAGALGLRPAAAAEAAVEDAPAPAAQVPLATRKLGRSGQEVSILTLGGMAQAHSPQYLEAAWSLGVRSFDTAAGYLGGRGEQHIAQWLERRPERRKDLFLVSKNVAREGPGEMLTQIDTRLERCGTDYLDVYLIHQFGPRIYGETWPEWLSGTELRAVAEKLKSDGKVRQFGFATHDGARAEILKAAAACGFIDTILVSYNPLADRGGELERALDACAEAGIGLIAMKVMRPMRNAPKRHPLADERDLTMAQAMLHAVWSDERFATVEVGADNIQLIAENVEAARKFDQPLPPGLINQLREVTTASGPSWCPNCDGRCARACGQELALNDIARYVSYYEQDGDLSARELYRALPESLRKPVGADLAAAGEACLCKLNHAEILRKAELYFG